MTAASKLIDDLLGRVFLDAGLTAPDGRPLYAYRARADLIAELAQPVGDLLRQNVALRAAAAGALCLVASSEFCRRYDGGPWSWNTILEPLGFQGDYRLLYEPIEEGLASFWLRDILRTAQRREFLTTLSCEGGLPMGILLSDSRYNVARYLRELLRLCETFQRPASEFAEREADILPLTLQNDVVFELASQIIDAVVDLRRQGVPPTINSGDPRLLRLPLRLDEESAQTLLRGLIEIEAPSHATGSLAFHVRTVLSLDAEPFLRRVFDAKTRVDAEALAEQLGIAADDLPSRFYLHLVCSDGNQPVAAIASRRCGEELYDIELQPGRILRAPEAVKDQVSLIAAVGGHEFACVQPSGGERLSEHDIWVFEGGHLGPAHRMLAMGSCRSPETDLIIALPTSVEPQHTEDYDFEYLGALLTPVARNLFRIVGTFSLDLGDGPAIVSTHRSDELTNPHVLRGTLRRLTPAGPEVWLGAPQLFEVFGDGLGRRSTAAVEWRCMNGSSWRPLSASSLGDGTLRAARSNGIVFRTRCTILPPDFRIDITPNDGHGGRINVQGAGILDAGIPSSDLLKWSKTPSQGGWSIDVVAIEPPAYVPVALRFDCGGEATLLAAFPASSVAFVAPGGIRLGPEEKVDLDSLSSIRARAVQPTGSVDLAIEMQLQQRGWQSVYSFPSFMDNPCREVVLDVIRDVIEAELGAVGDMDRTVRLRIIHQSGPMRFFPPAIQIGWYNASLEYDKQGAGLVALRRATPGRWRPETQLYADLDLLARPLDGPELPAEQVERQPGGWLFRFANKTAGPWLIVGRPSASVKLRPLIVTVPSGGVSRPPDSILVEAVRVRDRQARTTALAASVDALCADYGHRDWSIAQSFLRTLGDLPPPTYEVVSHIAAHPIASVISLLKSKTGDYERRWDAFEQLGRMWHLVPVHAWIGAAERFVDWIQRNEALWSEVDSSPALEARTRLRVMHDAGPRRARFVGVILALLCKRLPEWFEAPNLANLDRDEAEERKSLLRRHANDMWPTWAVHEAAEASDLDDDLRRSAPAVDLPHRAAVFQAPAFAAVASVRSCSLDAVLTMQLRRLRAFDKAWFDVAHAAALERLLLGSQPKKGPR